MLTRDAGNALIPQHAHLLTYCLSMRVIFALRGAEMPAQLTSKLYVAECRVKSDPHDAGSSSLQTAIRTLRYLEMTKYEKCVVPDSVAASLLTQGPVTHLLLGAEALYKTGDEITHFAATAGTDALLLAARKRRDVTVLVMAETKKIEEGGVPDHATPLARTSHPAHLAGVPFMTVSQEVCELQPGELVTEKTKLPDRRVSPAPRQSA